MVCILIELTQVFTESILVLKLQRKGLEVPFSLYWIALWLGHYGLLRRHIQSNLHQISFRSVHWINLRLLSSKIVSSRVGMLHNVHNFDGIMQKTHTVTSLQLGDVARYLILWQMELMKHPWLILCTIKLMSQHFLYYFQTILSLFC